MSNHESQLTQKLQISGQLSPQSRRNTKNLSLQLNRPSEPPSQRSQSMSVPSPTVAHTVGSPPTSARLYRHPSLSGSPSSSYMVQQANGTNNGNGLKRRTTLSLSIPSEVEVSRDSTSSSFSEKSSSISVPSFASASSTSSTSMSHVSSSPTMSSPIIPSTPKEHYSSIGSNYSNTTRSSHSSNSTLQNISNGGDLKTQTLMHNLSNIEISDDGDNSKLNAYPNGPALVLNPSVYLYSEPSAEQLKEFDLVINVAKELKPPIPFSEPLPKSKTVLIPHDSIEYYYVPWTHTSKLCSDLPFLTDKIIHYLSLSPTKKVLIHCQCGVSRSASLIVALIMKMNHINLNEAYNLLKERAPEISPNMTLIFQLMEWGDIIGVNGSNNQLGGLSPHYEMVESPLGIENDNGNLKRKDSAMVLDNDTGMARS